MPTDPSEFLLWLVSGRPQPVSRGCPPSPSRTPRGGSSSVRDRRCASRRTITPRLSAPGSVPGSRRELGRLGNASRVGGGLGSASGGRGQRALLRENREVASKMSQCRYRAGSGNVWRAYMSTIRTSFLCAVLVFASMWASFAWPAHAAVTTFDVADATAVEGQGVAFTIRRGGDTSAAATITYSTETGTAESSDFVGVTDAPITFAAGVSRRTVIVSTTQDVLSESSETFKLLLVDHPAGDWEGIGTIIDDDPIYAVDVSSVEEGQTATFTITRSTNTNYASTANYSTATGTATAADYASKTGSVNFAAGEITRTVPVVTQQDSLDEPDGAFTLVIATCPLQFFGTATILDNDLPPGVSAFSIQDDARLTEGDTALLTVRRTGDLTAQATVSYLTGALNATLNSDFSPVSGSLTFAPGEAIHRIGVSAIADREVDEPVERYSVDLYAPTGFVPHDRSRPPPCDREHR